MWSLNLNLETWDLELETLHFGASISKSLITVSKYQVPNSIFQNTIPIPQSHVLHSELQFSNLKYDVPSCKSQTVGTLVPSPKSLGRSSQVQTPSSWDAPPKFRISSVGTRVPSPTMFLWLKNTHYIVFFNNSKIGLVV